MLGISTKNGESLEFFKYEPPTQFVAFQAIGVSGKNTAAETKRKNKTFPNREKSHESL